jgi:hypothetical protein
MLEDEVHAGGGGRVLLAADLVSSRSVVFAQYAAVRSLLAWLRAGLSLVPAPAGSRSDWPSILWSRGCIATTDLELRVAVDTD